jgi:hypothetical protein
LRFGGRFAMSTPRVCPQIPGVVSIVR